MEIYIWGTGCGASEAIQNGLNPSLITAFIDSNPVSESFMGLPVIRPEILKTRNPGLIIITSRMADEISRQCREMGIPDDRLLFIKDHCCLCDRNKSCTAAEKLLGKELLAALIPKQQIITMPPSLQNPKLDGLNDPVRIYTLELLARKISSVPGALAELGVYKGSFAACMNRLLPERKLYLFDTFCGFGEKEGQDEKSRNNCSDAFLQAHKNTNVRLVLEKLDRPQNAIIKAGLFPESLGGLEECFALVSLDADFRDSTLSGLRYFWPRLSPGGYLMLHDWGSLKLRGVSEALEIYQSELGYKLPGVPIPDLGSSLVMQKI